MRFRRDGHAADAADAADGADAADAGDARRSAGSSAVVRPVVVTVVLC